MNEYNKKIMKFDEFTNEYNDRIDELNDAKLILRELKVELRERNLSENTFLFIIEDEVIVSTATFKKLFDSSIFTDDKDSIIDD
jgi:propanediol dehydratase large subunit